MYSVNYNIITMYCRYTDKNKLNIVVGVTITKFQTAGYCSKFSLSLSTPLIVLLYFLTKNKLNFTAPHVRVYIDMYIYIHIITVIILL
jgi:hypothetical protein